MEKDNRNAMKTSRRSFLTKSAAGVVLASLPARSVWASGFNTGSIVASSHASSWVGNSDILLGSHGFWKKSSRLQSYGERFSKFTDCFGIGAVPIGVNLDDIPGYSTGDDPLIFDILNGESSGLSGPTNVNAHMIAMYLNAKHSVLNGDVYYPVTNAGHFATLSDFANHLYENATIYQGSYGTALNEIICEYNRDFSERGIGCNV
jgi:hypothetical protein